jgi:hypothetical protein
MPTHAASENAPANVLTTNIGVLNLRTRDPFEKLARLPSVSPGRALRNPLDAPGEEGAAASSRALLAACVDDRSKRCQQQKSNDHGDDEESALHSRPSLKPKREPVTVVGSILDKTAPATVFFHPVISDSTPNLSSLQARIPSEEDHLVCAPFGSCSR